MKNSILIILTLFLCSCSVCPPQKDVINGKASQKHDTRKFRATYSRKGNYYMVRLENNFEIIKIKTPYKPSWKNGEWILCEQL